MEIQQHITHRFPRFELSYETIPHKKVSPNYNIAIAIPYGRKCYAWFTSINNKPVCILMELNRDKRVSKTEIIDTLFDPSLSVGAVGAAAAAAAAGTILYGTVEEKSQTDNGLQSFFVIEDIFYFSGLAMKHTNFAERLGYICQTMGLLQPTFAKSPSEVKQVVFCIPTMCTLAEPADYIPQFNIFTASQIEQSAYIPHHIQYRCLTTIEPNLNIFPPKINLGPVANTHVPRDLQTKPVSTHKPNYSKPQYNYLTVFIVMADIQCDIYRLYAYGSNRSLVYYGLAAIPNYHTSVFMNSIFRKIKENRNLDYIEESDDEDEFENTDETQFVDLEKREYMECAFHPKFKKWVPTRRIPPGNMVVHISKL